MKSISEILTRSPLFKGIAENSIEPMLNCLRAREKNYSKNEYIFHAGASTAEIGIVLTGMVQIIKEDVWGNNTILAQLTEGMLFGEAFVIGNTDKIPVSVYSLQASRILFLDKEKTVTPCKAACEFHYNVSHNMLEILAQKNIFLTERMEHLSKRTLRDKVLSYLSDAAQKAGSREFTIPFDRQGLADYLAADRSALSAVLGKLKDEEILDFKKNKFYLIN
ncbi:MAG: Crp/Fnr family transcriptional regulator [Candidatus Metalachnospira sp.]|nr:Crp/Fnr family transcriptional regulator [Candidatus Metalachnospira sp.]